MNDRITLSSIHGNREEVTVREHSVREDGLVLRRYGDDRGVYGTPFYATVSTESAKELRDFLLERYPLTEDADVEGFEPRTIVDGEGDVWVEVKPDRFALEGCEQQTTLDGDLRSIDYVDSTYGIDAGEPTRTAPAFEVGQRVEVRKDSGSGHGLKSLTRARVVGSDGGTFVIEDDGTNFESFRFELPRYVCADEITALDEKTLSTDQGYLAPEPKIRVMTNTRSTAGYAMPAWEGTRVEVLDEAHESYYLRAVDGRPDGMTADFSWSVSGVDLVDEDSLELSEESPFPYGKRVRISDSYGGPLAGKTGEVVKYEERFDTVYVRLEDVEGQILPAYAGATGAFGSAYVEDAPVEDPLAEWERELLGLTGEEPAPAFAPGDRVRIVGGPYLGDASAPGGTGTVTGVDEDGRFRVQTDDRPGARGQNLGYYEGEIEPFVQDAGDPIGQLAFVTGDSEGWEHDFLPGTEVEVVKDDYLVDGTYLVRCLRTGDDWYVGATDLALDEPVVTERDGFRVGDRVSGYGDAEGVIESFNAPRSPEGDVVVRWEAGAFLAGYTLGAALSNLKKVDEPVRFVLGADPAVVEWGEVMKRSLASTRDAMVQLPEVGIEFGTLESSPDFQVGDRVRLIDGGGDGTSSAKVGDHGTIERVGGFGSRSLLRVRMDDGHSTGRYASRWEKAGGDTDPRYCIVCRKAPCAL